MNDLHALIERCRQVAEPGNPPAYRRRVLLEAAKMLETMRDALTDQALEHREELARMEDRA